ncbi:SRPBCC family protein [Chlorobium ferrooxidans]|uniref:Cyclase/dehydrase n=1 Tax=Chlorobium ferrooxidans DSM 13031 TaxID=377431 RepID=Q0YRG4_9CHLB|nr:SRPBCC family protein [Chlorobium ferrooxidans]EAT58930.1 cyclase/dehydrase [Chlorobium ferrooxidans DSM 13031]
MQANDEHTGDTMKKLISTTRWVTMLLMIALHSSVSSAALPLPGTPVSSDTLSMARTMLLNGKIIVSLSQLENGVTGVRGDVYIAAPPETVWAVITDYNNHKNFVPGVLDSGIISDTGSEKVMFEKGKSGLFVFSKTVNVKMRVWGEKPKRLNFEQITGDFKVYHGEWLLLVSPPDKGTFLTYKAEVKPDFFAPGFAVRNVQKKECPLMLSAMKKRSESLTSLAIKSQ